MTPLGDPSKRSSHRRFRNVLAVSAIGMLIGLFYSIHVTFYDFRMPYGLSLNRTWCSALEWNVSGSERAQVRQSSPSTLEEMTTRGTTRGTARSSNETAASPTNSSSPSSSNKTVCPLVPPNLVGPLKIEARPPPLEEQEKVFSDLLAGGRYRPEDCVARHRVALIIPYRDRAEHLQAFLYHMHAMLRRQQLGYGIFVVEQAGNDSFNRGMLLNVGFLEASKMDDYQCFIFHDVDLLPEDDRNIYSCPEQPRHMIVASSKFGYRLPYKGYVGGACALSKEHMKLVNGFSNLYWGWGAEDDDMYYRITYHGLRITRYDGGIARYRALSHKQADANQERFKLLRTGRSRYNTDGLIDIKYNVQLTELKKLYTWIVVDLVHGKKNKSVQNERSPSDTPASNHSWTSTFT